MNKFSSLLILCALVALPACSWLPSWAGGKEEEKPKLAGERVTVLPVAESLQPDPTLKDVPVTLPSPAENSEWAQHGGGLNAAISNLSLKGSLDNSSHTSVGDGNEFENPIVPQPVVGGGMVFAMDQVGYVTAHDTADISHQRWQSKGVSETDEPDIIGGGLGYADGKLYITSGRGLVVALDATTGKELWRKSLHMPIVSAPKIAGGKLLAITVDNETFALSVANGDILWNHRGIDETSGLLNSVSPSIDGETAIIPYSSGEVFALSMTTGNPSWGDAVGLGAQTEAGGVFSGITGDPVIDGDAVFAVSNAGAIAAFGTARGQHIWDKPLSSINMPWVTGDYLYFLTSDNTLVCFVKYNGHIKWATKLPQYNDMDNKKDPINWQGPVMVNGKLAVIDAYGTMILVSAIDGKVTDTKEIPEDIYTAPIVAGGRMYLIDKGATLYSLQ